jgi:hypothetical protein
MNRSYHPGMPMWRCPHCGTPQAETARCWVCRRSSTACATCQNFRRSVAAQLGYCGLDRERRPLRGDEIRGCWEASTIPIEVVPTDPERRVPQPFHPVDDGTPVRKLEFVEVGAGAVTPPIASRASARPIEAEATEPAEPLPPVSPGEPRWSLWGDADV